ncbi:unknown [Firmicutes bacterium CAG:791]|nr:unknown [Firmicutes bacterium CAG:791]
MKLTGAIDSCRLNQRFRQHRIHVLLHIEEYRRRSHCRYNQRDEVIHQIHLRHQLNETKRGHLCRNHHNRKDKSERRLTKLKIIGMDGVCRHRREISCKQCRKGRHHQGIAQAGDNRKRSAEQVMQIRPKVRARQCRKASCQLRVASRCVDKKHVKPEQTNKGNQNKKHVAAGSSCLQRSARRLFLLSCNILHILSHRHLPLTSLPWHW